jgi:hypothetical protein
VARRKRPPPPRGPLERMSPFHLVDVLHNGRVVRVERTGLRFEDAYTLNQERLLLVKALNTIGRSGRCLLIDSRAAPHSTDQDLEQEFRRFRLEVARGFERVAALVRTKVAILQVTRLCADQAAVHPFNDEAAAIAYLLEPYPPHPIR